MKEILAEMVQQLAPHFLKARLSTNDTESRASASLDDKNLLATVAFKTHMPELKGDFGINDMATLRGLLDFPLYKDEAATFKVHRVKRDDVEYVSEFEFRDRHGGHSKYKTIIPGQAGDMINVLTIPWDVHFPLEKSKITEIAKLSGYFNDKWFRFVPNGGKMFMAMGGSKEVMHEGSLMLVDGLDESVTKLFKDSPNFDMGQFVGIIRNSANLSCELKLSSRGLLGVFIDSPNAVYSFYIRGKRV